MNITSKDKQNKLFVSEFRKLSNADRLRFLNSLTDEELLEIQYNWQLWARPKQLEGFTRDEWTFWLIQAGRGFGKTRTGAETTRAMVNAGYRHIVLCGPTPADVRDVMIDGESGLLAVTPPWEGLEYFPSKRQLRWKNGAVANIFSGAQPEGPRGQNSDFCWLDEPASWKYGLETFSNIELGCRLKTNGMEPKLLITGTPKNVPIIREIRKNRDGVLITLGSTYENSENLAANFLNSIKASYEGTRLGRQEINGELLDDLQSALWNREILDRNRIFPNCQDILSLTSEAEREEKYRHFLINNLQLKRIVVAVDPATTNNSGSNMTGIIVAGLGIDDQGYVLADYTTDGTPKAWAEAVNKAYRDWMADLVVYEGNQGGLLVESNIKTVDANIPCKKVTARVGKLLRAEPISTLYEQGRIHHVGEFNELEDQLCNWEPGMESPDRLDACVWAFTELMLNSKRDTPILGGISVSNNSEIKGRDNYFITKEVRSWRI